MKYKWILLVTTIALLLLSFLISQYENTYYERVHQHRVSSSYNELFESDVIPRSHLPIINMRMENGLPQDLKRLDGDQGQQSYSEFVDAIVELVDEEGKYNDLSTGDKEVVQSKVRYRGHSSIHFDKHSYKVNFLKSDGTENKKISLLGMGKHDEWILHGPYHDRTQIRNYLSMNVIGQIMPYTPDVRFCELYINGEYEGLYLAMETIAVGDDRIDITTYDVGDEHASYIIRLDWENDLNADLNTFLDVVHKINRKSDFSVVYPKRKLTEEVRHTIERDISDMQKAMFSFDYDSNDFGYRELFNVESFVDYFIVNEFFSNYDSGKYSTYLYKDIGGKITIGPAWDFNNAIGNYSGTFNMDFFMTDSILYQMLVKDEAFNKMVVDRYRVLRKTILNEEYLYNYIDETVAYLGPALDRNFEKWGDTLNGEHAHELIVHEQLYLNPNSYEESIEILKEYIANRGSWLDEHIETIYRFSHYSIKKEFENEVQFE